MSFEVGDRVVYIPQHAKGDRRHKDCERGVVFSVRDGNVFVKFQRAIDLYGEEQTIAQCCRPVDLVRE